MIVVLAQFRGGARVVPDTVSNEAGVLKAVARILSRKQNVLQSNRTQTIQTIKTKVFIHPTVATIGL